MDDKGFFDGLEDMKQRVAAKERREEAGGGAPQPRLLQVLREISDLFNSPIYNFEEILEIILDVTIRLTKADRGFLMLYDERDRLEVRIAKNMNYQALAEGERRISTGVIDSVIASGKGVFIPNVETEQRFSAMSSIIDLHILSVLCVPLKMTLRDDRSHGQESRQIGPLATRKILGVIYVDSRSVTAFPERDLELFETLANWATTAILNAQLYRQATTDELSGLFTRRHFEQRLVDEVKLARKSGSPLSLLIVDVDHLRAINERFGYHAGDAVLRRAAEQLRRRTRLIDHCARYGGEKFAVILPQTDLAGTDAVAQKIIHAVADEPFLEGKAQVTVSIGGAGLEADDAPGMLVKRADQALYEAKRTGRNRFAVYRPELADTAKRTDKLAGVFSGDPSRDYRNTLMLLETIASINTTYELERLLPLVLDTIVDITQAERGILFLRESDGRPEVKVARDREKRDADAREFSHSIVEKVIATENAVRIQDVQSDRRDQTVSIDRLELRSIMCVPLPVVDKIRGEPRVIGAIYVDSKRVGEGFSETSLAFFDTLARQVAVAIDNARLYGKVAELAKALEVKLERREQELHEVKVELEERTREVAFKYNYDQIIGKSKKMQDLFRILDRITDTHVPVYIHGESGTGKELVAKAIHYNGSRRKERIVSENCAAMSESLLESELFGYTKGSFTGAQGDRKGLFEVATAGTLFLDEVGDMSLSMQKKLLRVLQEGEIRRIGGKDPIKVDVRIISASNKDLKRLLAEGKFREDLYYRLNVVKVDLPPLRERKEDLPLLIDHFLREDDGTPGRVKRVDTEAMNLLLRYGWPGNVRELRNVIERAKIISEGDTISRDSIILDASSSGYDAPPAPEVGAAATVPATMPGPGGVPMPTAPGLTEMPKESYYFGINERQRKLVEYLKTYGSIRNRDYYEIMQVSKSTGWRDLKDLIRRAIIEVHGKGKGSVYSLKGAGART